MNDTALATMLDDLTSAVVRLSERSDELSALPGFSGLGRAAELVGILDDVVAEVRSLAASLPGRTPSSTPVSE